jgi:hypothetical protein
VGKAWRPSIGQQHLMLRNSAVCGFMEELSDQHEQRTIRIDFVLNQLKFDFVENVVTLCNSQNSSVAILVYTLSCL